MAPAECWQGKNGGAKGKKGGSKGKGDSKGKKGHSKGQKCGSKGKGDSNGKKGHSKGKKGQKGDSKGKKVDSSAMEAEAPADDSDGSGGVSLQQAIFNHPLLAPGGVSSHAASGPASSHAASARVPGKLYTPEQLQRAQALKEQLQRSLAEAQPQSHDACELTSASGLDPPGKGVKNAADGVFASKQKSTK